MAKNLVQEGFLLIAVLATIFPSCSGDDGGPPIQNEPEVEFISAVDISSYPEIREVSPIFYNQNGQEENFLSILEETNINTIRLRLWVNPANGRSGFDEVKIFSDELKDMGFKIWLSIHYSDTWADPGHQEAPQAWQNLTFASLKDSVYDYTANVVAEIQPEYIQIGNEINNGFLHPQGQINTTLNQFKELLTAGVKAARDNSNNSKIIIHHAGTENADWFYDQLIDIDYDIIGISYYPIWHGKSLGALNNELNSLRSNFQKQVVIAETAYPFTLGWNDWTNNIVGLEEQLILPEFPATPEGQKEFIAALKDIAYDTEKGGGICYWGAELVAWKGNQATDASPWENQALFDFDNKALPVLSEF